MKHWLIFTAALITGAGSTTLLAGDNEINHERCKAAIEYSLGEDTATRLYDIRHRRSGDRLRIKAFPEQGESLMLDCWVYRDGGLSVQTREGMVLHGPSDDSRQLTLSE